MSEVVCNGSETSLFQCSHTIQSSAECAGDNIAGVICQGACIHVYSNNYFCLNHCMILNFLLSLICGGVRLYSW